MSLGALSLHSQVIDTLPTNKEGFIQGLKGQFDATNRSDLKFHSLKKMLYTIARPKFGL